MDRLLRMDKDEYLRAMRSEVDRILGQIADAVNDAPDGKVINASQERVRDFMGELRQTAFQTAEQMRINSTKLSFSPSEGCVGSAQAAQGPLQSQRADDQRTDRDPAEASPAPRHEGYAPFWAKLVDWRSGQRGSKRQAADGLLHDVAQRQDMLAYAQFERDGWHVGSGPIEAMCRATTRRLKGPGMRWDADHAEGVMALEALHQSNPWDRYGTNTLCPRN